MSVDLSSLSTSATTSTSANADKAKAKSALDKDAFLKLLVAQISHQDPLKPMDDTAFVQQLSQFAQVEQSIAQSAHLESLSNQLGGLSNNGVAGLVGSTVSVRGRSLSFDGAQPAQVSGTLPAPANVVATIKDASGNVVRTMDVGSKPAGPVSFAWDGRDDGGKSLGAGNYTVDLKATNADGVDIPVTQDVTGTVVKVSFEKGYAELVLDSGATAPVSNLIAVLAGKK
jgi:flagellar basal-body rod modification protein FlgD